MIDERQQELATLYSLGLLEGSELTAFEIELKREAELSQLVDELREAAAAYALSAPPAVPSAALKGRIMDRIDAESAPTANVVQFPRWMFLAWAVAACFALGCAWLGHLYLAVRTENLSLRDQQMLATMEVRGAQLQVEAERVISQGAAKDTQKQLADLKQQLASAQDRVALREKDIASMGQRIDALTGASAEASRLLVAAREQIATLDEKIRNQGDLAQFKIATLASMAGNSPQALAVAVWNPKAQEGVLSVAKLPALASDKDYQLWLIDPAYPAPVDGGVFTVDPATGDARVNFRPNQRVNNAAKFAISLERKGGVKKAEGPIVLIGD